MIERLKASKALAESNHLNRRGHVVSLWRWRFWFGWDSRALECFHALASPSRHQDLTHRERKLGEDRPILGVSACGQRRQQMVMGNDGRGQRDASFLPNFQGQFDI